MDKEKRIRELIDALNAASERYYNGLEESMSNFEWDAMFDELTNLEQETGIVFPDSPTQKAGAEETGGEKEAHEYPALSLAKTKKIEDLKEFAGDRDIYLSYKLDGLTLVLTYDGGVLQKILTRGNGQVGSNITYLKDSIIGIPEKIEEKGHMVVRGEAIISYTDFEIINDTIDDEDERYANPRNLASGTLALDDKEKVKARHVHFIAFTLVHLDYAMKSFGERMAYLKKLGFNVVEHELTNSEKVTETLNKFTEKVESGKMDFPVDGLVITYDDTDYAATGSVTGHHATRAGLAFKWQDTVAESELLYIEWSCAIATISPVAVFKPVNLEGTKVERASLCNVSEIERLGIGDKGTKIEVIKSNKIIPKVIGVKEKVGELIIPDKCPACNAPTRIKISEKSGTKTLHCTNPSCPAKDIKRFTRFVSKQGLDIDGLSIQTIVRFVNLGYIKTLPDFYKLDRFYEEIAKLDGFGDKSVENLANSINKSKEASPINFIYSLCIPKIGLDAAKRIVAALGFKGFVDKMYEREILENIDKIGPERANSIIEYFSDEKKKTEFTELLSILNIKDEGPKDTSGGELAGLTFVITGDVNVYKNRDEFKAYVESKGGSVTGSVSKKTNYLVNNDVESTSSKNMKAKELNIPIISEAEFIERFDKERSL
ncbi:MAG: NAD-dependent DNA ligase LigA [Lachnospiraceae bacterium]|nr:NAD-dependent DNA ligase LigA [Lachnospiraceae bacterium]